ncbi:MAG: hypothetical protein JWP14_3023 [Frankiales bacterium]|nr:hypothetical protein [Frankiales bacterium]
MRTSRVLTLLALQVSTAVAGAAIAVTPSATASPAPTTGPKVTMTVTNVRPVARALKVPSARPVRKAAPVKAQPARRVPARPQVRSASASRPRPQVRPALTMQQRLAQAIARIPGYRTAAVAWQLQANDGHWGTADWYHNVIWISPRVPANRLYDVVIHEWSHVKSVQDYGGNVDVAVGEMNRYFGGSGLTGAERAADCMALVAGAHWTHYTPCDNKSWRAGASRLLAGGKL